MIAPSSGGPAEAAGVAPKDVLQAVDGASTAGLSLFDVGDMLQGPEGSQVRLAPFLPATESGQPGSWPYMHTGPGHDLSLLPLRI